MSQPALEDRPSASGSFPTTHWSGILAAGQGTGAAAERALAELCRIYWYPIYAFARRKGHQPADAQDLTQAFFTHIIDSQLVRKADPERGRFRSFLLTCFTRFLASEADRSRALKRGGGSMKLSIDFAYAEHRFATESALTANPEELFDRHWAVSVLEAALTRLETELKESGRSEVFEALLPGLQGENDSEGWAAVARRLNTTEATIRVTLHRLRRRYRELVRAVVSQTVNNPVDVDAEMAHLVAVLRG